MLSNGAGSSIIVDGVQEEFKNIREERALPTGTIKQSEVKAEFNKGDNLRAYLGAADGVPSSGNLKLTDFRGKSADNSLSSFVHNTNVWTARPASSSTPFNPSSDTNVQSRDPTAVETMYWNRGDQPFDGTTNGSFSTSCTGSLYRYYGSRDNGQSTYCQGNGRFGEISGGNDNYYQDSTSCVWAFPWQKITKGPHTFYGNWYAQVTSYPSAGITQQWLYLVEFDTWTLDPYDNTRGILSNRVARTLLWSRSSSVNESNWAAQTWSKNHTTTGRYLVLDYQANCAPNHYTKYYMSCNVS